VCNKIDLFMIVCLFNWFLWTLLLFIIRFYFCCVRFSRLCVKMWKRQCQSIGESSFVLNRTWSPADVIFYILKNYTKLPCLLLISILFVSMWRRWTPFAFYSFSGRLLLFLQSHVASTPFFFFLPLFNLSPWNAE
jgi:hypothetical protein